MFIIKEARGNALSLLNNLPDGRSNFFAGDSKEITSIFQLSKKDNNLVLTDFEKNEHNSFKKVVPIKNIKITQPNVLKSRIERMIPKYKSLPTINAVKYNNEIVIYDGHHRLTTAYLLGIKNIKVNLVEVK